MIIYSDRLVPKGFGAITIGSIIFMRPKHKGDEGLLAHEMVHVRQWKEAKGTFWIKYLTCKEFRLKCEVEAYKVQLQHDPENLIRFARYLATGYNLDITLDQAIKLLSN